jgi:hypothetical protein
VEGLGGLGEGDQRGFLDRPAGEHRGRRGLEIDPPVEGFVERLVARPVDDDADRSLVVVLEHEDHRAIEVGVLERGCGDEEAALRRRRARNHVHSLPDSSTSCGPAGEFGPSVA